MTEKEIFYFDIEGIGIRAGIKPVRASDLETAVLCLQKMFPTLKSYKQMRKEDVPKGMLARMSKPFDCPDDAATLTAVPLDDQM